MLTLLLLVILTEGLISVSVHYNAEIERAVIDMMQLKNLHGNITIERVYDCADIEWVCKNFFVNTFTA